MVASGNSPRISADSSIRPAIVRTCSRVKRISSMDAGYEGGKTATPYVACSVAVSDDEDPAEREGRAVGLGWIRLPQENGELGGELRSGGIVGQRSENGS